MNAPPPLTGPRRDGPRPHAEAGPGSFVAARRLVNGHPLAADGILAGALLVVSTVWLVLSPFAGLGAALTQVALIVPLAARRSYPAAVFVLVALVGLIQWIVGPPLIADGSLLVALYTVAVHESRSRALFAAAALELGAILAATRWHPADTVLRSLAFLTATVVAALCAGLTVRSGSEYLAWLAERSRRLEVERDQQASIAAAEERTRIAREMHDIVAHSLSVLVTLLDAASLVNRSDPDRAEDAMHHASVVSRQALGDMRTMIGVLRTDSFAADLVPQPDLTQLDSLLDRVRATGLNVGLHIEGRRFVLGTAAELTLYRIVQESLTNTLKHATATGAQVVLRYDRPTVTVEVSDNGIGAGDGDPRHASHDPHEVTSLFPASGAGHGSDAGHGHGHGHGHGIDGMRERAALHRGSLTVGPVTGGGWKVTAILHLDVAEAAS